MLAKSSSTMNLIKSFNSLNTPVFTCIRKKPRQVLALFTVEINYILEQNIMNKQTAITLEKNMINKQFRLIELLHDERIVGAAPKRVKIFG
uniref:Uncharacterized protein n=1 Tax=Onchocerca volvulus TaxID=6282 RepID=A0A8R1XLP8_ONCVO